MLATASGNSEVELKAPGRILHIFCRIMLKYAEAAEGTCQCASSHERPGLPIHHYTTSLSQLGLSGP